MQIQPDKPPNLLFHHQRDWVSSLPMDAPGVDGILLHIRQLPGFDEAAFQDALGRKENARIPVLRRAPSVNARLDTTGDHLADRRVFDQDFDIGLRLVATGEHIPWKMTMDAAFAHFGTGQGTRKDSSLLIGPVQLGALHINENNASSGIYRSDVPIISWSAKLILLQDGWAENERLLIAYFHRMLGDPANVQSIAYSGETTTSWKRGGISVTVRYRRSTIRQPEEGYCEFVLYNTRDYPDFLTDTYCSSVQPAHVETKLFSVPKIELSSRYSLSPYVRATPPGLRGLFSGSGNFLVWIDHDRTRVGFADRSFAAIYPRTKVACLYLQNKKPERGGGPYSSLWVELIGQKNSHDPPEWCRSAGEADFGAFDAILKQIAELTALPAQKLDDLTE